MYISVHISSQNYVIDKATYNYLLYAYLYICKYCIVALMIMNNINFKITWHTFTNLICWYCSIYHFRGSINIEHIVVEQAWQFLCLHWWSYALLKTKYHEHFQSPVHMKAFINKHIHPYPYMYVLICT